MTKKTKEVAVQESNLPSNEFAGMFDQSLQSAGDTMDAEDIRLPKLTLIQAMTKSSFNTENVNAGNYINSIEKNDMGSDLEMFVMSDAKLWQFDYGVPQGKGKEDKKEYLTIVDFADCPKIRDNFKKTGQLQVPQHVLDVAENKGIDPTKILQPDLIYRFHVLLVNEVVEGTAFPYIIDFKRSSAGEGNKLKNIFFKMRRTLKLPSYARVFKLGAEFIQAEYDYYAKKVSTGRNITKEELTAVESWVRELSENSANYSADESDAFVEEAVIVEAEVITNDGEKPKF